MKIRLKKHEYSKDLEGFQMFVKDMHDEFKDNRGLSFKYEFMLATILDFKHNFQRSKK